MLRYRYIEAIHGKDILHNTVGKAYENSSSATKESVDFQMAEDDQEVKVNTHVYKGSLVVTSDGSQNKRIRTKFAVTRLD